MNTNVRDKVIQDWKNFFLNLREVQMERSSSNRPTNRENKIGDIEKNTSDSTYEFPLIESMFWKRQLILR
eukprot:CAMPEP_0202980414 /NCGR_PEP_ID=MMETSP1396-20130829/86350_1 /ASSEMBLY_ACC=CAM_ASM_000872 /TAXON_ID= /ORGANISM="Pseudokeronopsis sp., Strain Brazil" /LENGTH=69 /DNA_ID=CAMNT_0049720387 /DNA_START=794 /DNA_END=1003 /DNA_ORIENTATION=+